MARYLTNGAEAYSLALDRNHVASACELYVRFALWANQKPQPLVCEQIERHFSVSRATAYRWRNAYEAATGSATARSTSHAGGNRPGASKKTQEENEL